MATPKRKDNLSSNEILNEIFKALEDKLSSIGVENAASKDDDEDGSKSDAADSSSKKRSKKSSKHHKKHKKHHKHKHKRRKKSETGCSSSCDQDDPSCVKDSSVKGVDSSNEMKKQVTNVIESEISKAQPVLDGEKVALIPLTVASTTAEKQGGTRSPEQKTRDGVDSRNELRLVSDAVAKRPVEALRNDDGQDEVTPKKRKTESSSPPSNRVTNVASRDSNSSKSIEREEGEVSEEGNSVKSIASSPASFAKSKDEGHSKKHKKSKHKRKKKRKSKEIRRFTSPLAVALTARSRRLLPPPRSRSRSWSRSHSRSRSRSRSFNKDPPSSRDRSPKSRGLRRDRRSRSSSADKRRSLRAGTPINKVRLLEIARKNAMTMMAQGRLPAGLPVPSLEKGEVVAIKSGGKSLAELNDFCKLLSKKESEGGDGSDEDKSLFIHHPFKPREHQPNIVMNIRNSVQIPVKTSAEKVAEGSKLRIQFPVSSGTQHRKKEFEWVPVSPDKEEISKSSSSAVVPLASASTPVVQQPILKKAAADPKEPLALLAPPPPPPTPPPPSSPKQLAATDSVFPMPAESLQKLDIGSIVSQRLRAVRKLKDNPHDIEALCQMYKSQQEMSFWAQSKQLPGQFTGSTDATILTPQQLAGPAHLQAWVKKDQFSRVAPVHGGVGMQMLQRMGWKPGEGLGKNKEGQSEPIILDIKLDKKGLVSQDELPRNNKRTNAPATTKDLSGKHPVSALVELCNKRRWGAPDFMVVFDSGPDHKKNFVFKVKVNGVEYQPTIASLNKKHAKAQCATVCLQALGLLPRDFQNPI